MDIVQAYKNSPYLDGTPCKTFAAELRLKYHLSYKNENPFRNQVFCSFCSLEPYKELR